MYVVKLWTFPYYTRRYFSVHIVTGIIQFDMVPSGPNIITVFFFCKGNSVKQMLDHLDGEVSKTSITQWFNYFRDVCTRLLG